MGILSEQAAQAAATAIERALPDTAAITRVTRTQDATTGAWSETTATYASGIPCRVDKSGLSPRERAIAERYGSVQTFNLMLSGRKSRWPGSVISVQSSDRIVVSGEGSGEFEPAESSGPVTDQLVVELVAIKIS